MALHGYLVGEIAEDFGEGMLTRREALRRLGMLGLTVTAAGAVLAACGGDDDDDGDDSASVTTAAVSQTTLPTDDPPGSSQAVKAEVISFTGPAGQLQGAYAAAGSPKGAVLVIHENRGLTPHFLDLPGRLAGAGYTALAIDLLSRQGGTSKLDEAGAQAGLGNAPEADLLADLRAGITELQKRAPNQKIGVVGFCFGGGMVWNLLNAGEDRIAAAAPFYGPAPATPDFSKAKAAVFGFYGADDARVNGTKAAADTALEAAGLTHDSKIFDGAGHAFFNNTGQRYNATAAKEAWSILLSWFDNHL